MSSTNVHSNKNMYIVGGDTRFRDDEKEPVDMRQYNSKGEPLAGKGPSRIEVVQGPNTIISAQTNIVVKDEKKVIGRATNEGQILSGDAKKVGQAIRNNLDMGRE